MNELVGKEFKRNVYGLSSWTDVVQSTHISWKIIDRGMKLQVPELKIVGTNHEFSLSEIVFIRDLDKYQLFAEKKEEQRVEMIKKFLNGEA